MHDLIGHGEARRALQNAFHASTLPASLLFMGPRGIGKQRLALWLAQLTLCESPGPDGPCDGCRHCRRVLRLGHPDVHWFFPLPRPRGASNPEKLAEALEQARYERLAELREDGLRISWSDEPTGIYLAAAQTIRRKAQSRPSDAGSQLFIIADAETLVPQESSPEAANALLKLLEEPPNDTRFILTSSEPGRLLDTIRSRTVPLHLAPLPEEEVARFLMAHREVSDEEAARAARLGGGGIGMALGFLPDGDERGPLDELRRRALDLLRRAMNPRGGAAYAAALDFRPSGARGLLDLFAWLDTWIRDLAAVLTGADEAVVNLDAAGWLREQADRAGIHAFATTRALEVVESARMEARGNVNPQLIVAGLVRDLGRQFREGV